MTDHQLQIPRDSLRRVLRQAFEAPEFEWDETPNAVSWLRARYEDLLLWLDGLHAAHPVAYWAMVGCMVVILVALLVHFGSLAVQALRYESPIPVAPRSPGAVVHDASWHLDEARRLGATGRYADALKHRFAALLLTLDGQKAVRFHPAKTPAEYVREARVEDAVRSQLGRLVADLYRYLFGGVPCDQDCWARFDRTAAEVEQYVAPS